MREFITERWTHILADSWQHLSLVVQCLILATIIAVVCAALSYQHPRLAALANNVSTVGLTIPLLRPRGHPHHSFRILACCQR